MKSNQHLSYSNTISYRHTVAHICNHKQTQLHEVISVFQCTLQKASASEVQILTKSTCEDQGLIWTPKAQC